MFWGAILYGHDGSMLPYHLYTTPYETKEQKKEAEVQLVREYQLELAEVEWFNQMGFDHPNPPKLKERKKDRKGGIDWFIYRECILNPLLYPLACNAQVTCPNLLIMEDNAPSHIHQYHDLPRERLGLRKLTWPANLPDLNPIESIWCEMKDRLRERLGIRMTATAICQVVLEEWINYPAERINKYIDSMPLRIEACIKDEGGNGFNY
ncbi:hypothetical protein L873DRAFT_870818 [Choiromyces venosus 120613-1]|uniref:Tc1-like transposase DDE domain-containing protein n=1 Tax=Choiromyces venosus 120613-1 TaxID=1336337 RepID=A0A3N4IWW4_9PEZI|nr:hypothetical protein L873DRAFT_870818 [Choiromyces venosus 120613-1]